jgi:hypothetical protein
MNLRSTPYLTGPSGKEEQDASTQPEVTRSAGLGRGHRTSLPVICRGNEEKSSNKLPQMLPRDGEGQELATRLCGCSLSWPSRREPNWLPAPKGPFVIFMRLYWPKEAAFDGSWKQPPMTKTP